MSGPIDYRYVDVSPIDTSETHILPKIAAAKGEWGKSVVLDAEDPAFLVEAMGERFGADSVSAHGYGRATAALDYARLATVADKLYRARNGDSFAKPMDERLSGTEDRCGTNGVADRYLDMFGIPLEMTSDDWAAWRRGRPLDVADVEKLYRDMRKYDLRAIWGTELVINNRVPVHSNKGAPIMPEETEGNAPIIWGWRSNGPCVAFQNAGQTDVLTHEAEILLDMNIVTVDGIDWSQIDRGAMKCLVDYEVYVAVGKRGGFWTHDGEASGGTLILNRGVWSSWLYANADPVNYGRYVDPFAMMRPREAVIHTFPGFENPWSATEENVRQKFFNDGVDIPVGMYNDDWFVEVGVTMSSHMVIGYPRWRTNLGDWIDKDGCIVKSN